MIMLDLGLIASSGKYASWVFQFKGKSQMHQLVNSMGLIDNVEIWEEREDRNKG